MKDSTDVLLNRKDALELYKENMGRNITYSGLYYIALKNHFVINNDLNKKLFFSKEKMIQYFKKVKEKIPEGFLSVGELSKKYKITENWVYQLMNNEKKFEYGIRKIIYYSEKDFLNKWNRRNYDRI